jgi:ribosomal protein L10
LKGAYINAEIYIGDDQLDALATIKSREELIRELIGLLQSPAQRVISALQNQFLKLRLLKLRQRHNIKGFSSIYVIYNAHNKQNIILQIILKR